MWERRSPFKTVSHTFACIYVSHELSIRGYRVELFCFTFLYSAKFSFFTAITCQWSQNFEGQLKKHSMKITWHIRFPECDSERDILNKRCVQTLDVVVIHSAGGSADLHPSARYRGTKEMRWAYLWTCGVITYKNECWSSLLLLFYRDFADFLNLE